MKTKKGFTLIEIIITIGIISILMLISYPRLDRALDNYRLKTGARQVVSDIRRVQFQTMEGSFYNLTFDKNNNIYRENRGTTTRTIELPEGIEIRAVNFASGNKISFTLKGVPKEPGHVRLTNRQGKTVRITVVPATGRVRLSYED